MLRRAELALCTKERGESCTLHAVQTDFSIINKYILTVDRSNKKPLHYTPWNGRFYFWHKHHLLVFRRMQKQSELGFPREEVSISCFSRCPNVLKEFLDECRCHYLEPVQNKTSVFEHNGDKWKPSQSRNKRHISTVILDEKVKRC